MKSIEGNIVDILNRKIYPAEIRISSNGEISEICPNSKKYDQYICPGFIDAHVHIESSMLTPCEFSKTVIQKGTIAVITDPHEIANVLGKKGIQFMIDDSRRAVIKIYFGIPSCVPATPYDSAGHSISAEDVQELAESGNFILLSEMMNVPGVIHKDQDVIAKLEIAQKYGLFIDGHAPLLRGDDLTHYIQQGISTDHESSTIEEALEKISKGMKILIREGSAAKNYEALKSLIKTNPDDIMFCTDDSHPDDLIWKGHIDKIVKKAITDGFDLFDVLQIACLNPVWHYKLDTGLLEKGQKADFVIFRNLQSFDVLSVYIDGIEKYNNEYFHTYNAISAIKYDTNNLNKFNHQFISLNNLKKKADEKNLCIGIISDEIVTKKSYFTIKEPVENLESDLEQDILKIVYINRYNNGTPQLAFIHGFGLKKGAFASTISHDSHNIIAIGTNDHDLKDAVNAIIASKGGLVVSNGGETDILSLPIGGIMTDETAEQTALKYQFLNNRLKEMGCKPESPFMTLSFMSLIVIPELKIGEKGLFDFNSFFSSDQ